MRQIAIIGTIIGLCLATGAPVMAAGQYKLAWWRELGSYENAAGSGCTGNHVMVAWVFDETGGPKADVQLRTTWGTLLGTTDADGRCQITIDSANTRYDMICVDGTGATSDVAYEMSSRLTPCWGHYSFELGFLYKTAPTNPGTFDTSMSCTINPGCADYGTCPESLDAPYTKSLAFNGINCADFRSDETALGNSQPSSSYFGQTFVATANRVMAVRAHGTIGGNNTLDFNARIVTWPAMQPVGPVRSTQVRYPFGWVITWGVNEVPVVAGQTYMLKIWRDGGGMNSYHVIRNNYAGGQYYEGGTASSGYELEGWVCCMDGAVPTIHIVNGPTVSNIKQSSATIAWQTDAAGDSRVDYGLSTSYGSARTNSTLETQHSMTLTGLQPLTPYHCKVTSAADGYNPAVSNDLTFTTTARVVRGDFDGDHDVDQEDFGHLQNCITGPGVTPTDPSCLNAELDEDQDVDAADVEIFLACFSGAGNPANPNCGP